MITRGRTNKPAGESHYRAVLTEEIVRAMRADYMPYVFSYAKCAKKYGVPAGAAQAAITRETWAHVK